jgi:hypothetical protein
MDQFRDVHVRLPNYLLGEDEIRLVADDVGGAETWNGDLDDGRRPEYCLGLVQEEVQ